MIRSSIMFKKLNNIVSKSESSVENLFANNRVFNEGSSAVEKLPIELIWEILYFLQPPEILNFIISLPISITGDRNPFKTTIIEINGNKVNKEKFWKQKLLAERVKILAENKCGKEKKPNNFFEDYYKDLYVKKLAKDTDNHCEVFFKIPYVRFDLKKAKHITYNEIKKPSLLYFTAQYVMNQIWFDIDYVNDIVQKISPSDLYKVHHNQNLFSIRIPMPAKKFFNLLYKQKTDLLFNKIVRIKSEMGKIKIISDIKDKKNDTFSHLARIPKIKSPDFYNTIYDHTKPTNKSITLPRKKRSFSVFKYLKNKSKKTAYNYIYLRFTHDIFEKHGVKLMPHNEYRELKQYDLAEFFSKVIYYKGMNKNTHLNFKSASIIENFNTLKKAQEFDRKNIAENANSLIIKVDSRWMDNSSKRYKNRIKLSKDGYFPVYSSVISGCSLTIFGGESYYQSKQEEMTFKLKHYFYIRFLENNFKRRENMNSENKFSQKIYF